VIVKAPRNKQPVPALASGRCGRVFKVGETVVSHTRRNRRIKSYHMRCWDSLAS